MVTQLRATCTQQFLFVFFIGLKQGKCLNPIDENSNVANNLTELFGKVVKNLEKLTINFEVNLEKTCTNLKSFVK